MKVNVTGVRLGAPPPHRQYDLAKIIVFCMNQQTNGKHTVMVFFYYWYLKIIFVLFFVETCINNLRLIEKKKYVVAIIMDWKNKVAHNLCVPVIKNFIFR